MLGCKVIVLFAALAVSAALPRPQISAGIGSLPALQIPENWESLLPVKPDETSVENETPSIISPELGSDKYSVDNEGSNTEAKPDASPSLPGLTWPVRPEASETAPELPALPGSIQWPRPEATEPKPEETPSLPAPNLPGISWPVKPDSEPVPEIPALPGSIPWPVRPETSEPKPEEIPSLPGTISIPWPIRPEAETNPVDNPSITIPLPESGSISGLFPINPETGSISIPINLETGSISLPINPEGGSIFNPETGTITLPINPESGSISLPIPGGSIINPETGTITLPINPETGTIALPSVNPDGSIQWPIPIPEGVSIDIIRENLPEGTIESIKEMLPEGMELPAMPKWLKWLIDHPTVAKWLKMYVSTLFWMQRQPEMGKLPFLNPAWLQWLQERPGYLPVPSVLPEELPWWYLSQYTAPTKNAANSRYLESFYLPYNPLPQF